MLTQDTAVVDGNVTRPVRRERVIGGVTVLVAAAVLLLAAQLHRWIAPHHSSGARGELVPLLVTAPLAWVVVFGVALIGPHRAAETAPVSRRYALGLGIVAVPCVVLAYWTPIPWALGVAGLLLVHRAQATTGDHRRADLAAQVLAYVAIVAPVLIFAGVLISARS